MELFIQHSLAHTGISETRYACVHSPGLLGSVLLHCDRPRSTRESLKFMLAFVRPGYSGGSVLPHCDGPRSIRESLHACVHSPRLTLLGRQRSAILLRRAAVHSRVPAYLCSFTQVTRGQRSATLRRASIHSRISVCLCSSSLLTHCGGHSVYSRVSVSLCSFLCVGLLHF